MAKTKKTTPIEEQVEEVVTETFVVEEVQEEVAPVEDVAVVGKVVNCSRLNVRKSADINAKVVCEINAGEEVIIEETLEQFYKVLLGNGKKGFCMKKYIKIK